MGTSIGLLFVTFVGGGFGAGVGRLLVVLVVVSLSGLFLVAIDPPLPSSLQIPIPHTYDGGG